MSLIRDISDSLRMLIHGLNFESVQDCISAKTSQNLTLLGSHGPAEDKYFKQDGLSASPYFDNIFGMLVVSEQALCTIVDRRRQRTNEVANIKIIKTGASK